MENKEIIKLINKAIEKVRPYIQADGGDVEFSRLEDDVVFVRVLGACVECSSKDVTITELVESIILDEVIGVKAVKLEEDEFSSSQFI